jgi:CHAD domain-containing protein
VAEFLCQLSQQGAPSPDLSLHRCDEHHVDVSEKSYMEPRRPTAIFEEYRDTFFAELPRVRDGDPDAIHQARIATRQLRELLPLLHQDRRRLQTSMDVARTAGRALGRVRELDVLSSLLRKYEERVPATASATTAARARLAGQQDAARRWLIKRLDAIDFQPLRTAAGRSSFLTPHRGAWKNVLRDHLATHARNAREALHHASGVYLPNRSHSLRIRVKRLRYAMEAAEHTGLFRAPEALEDVKRVQARLGQIRDAHLLRSGLADWLGSDSHSDAARTLTGVLDAEVQRRQQQFLLMRDTLSDVVRLCQHRFSRQARPGVAPWLLMSAAVPGILVIGTELVVRRDSAR